MTALALAAGLSDTVGTVLLARPSDGDDFTPTSVTPGLAGAVAMLILGLAVLLLALDMSRRIRRVQARARVEEKLRLEDEAAAEAEREAADEDGTSAEREGEASDEGGSTVEDAPRPTGDGSQDERPDVGPASPDEDRS